MVRHKSERLHQQARHQARRLAEDRAQHSNDGYHHGSAYADGAGPRQTHKTCPCFWDPRAIARFREQPKHCARPNCCSNPRRDQKGVARLTLQERRQDERDVAERTNA
jgi:hypothetical protein